MKLNEKEKNRLKKKYGTWAVITGASSGIGRELAYNLATAGFDLVLSARNLQVLEEMKDDLERKWNVKVEIVAADATTSEGRNRLIEATETIDVGLLIVSAGYGTSGLFLESNLPDEIDMLRLNCEALLSLTHHFSKKFAHQRRGGIILMSSMVAFQGVPYAANYAATKAYVQSLAEALAEELKPFEVDVLAAAPGPVASGFGTRANMKMTMSLQPSDVGIPILRALGRKSTVLPGFLIKFLVYSLQTVPRWAKVKIMKKVMGGMTSHQRE